MLLPGMITKKKGAILSVGSIVGEFTVGAIAYAASMAKLKTLIHGLVMHFITQQDCLIVCLVRGESLSRSGHSNCTGRRSNYTGGRSSSESN